MPFPRSLDRLRPALSPEEERKWIHQLRSEQTEAEAALWQLLRNRKLIGGKFRRQVQVGRYVADFYCHERIGASEKVLDQIRKALLGR